MLSISSTKIKVEFIPRLAGRMELAGPVGHPPPIRDFWPPPAPTLFRGADSAATIDGTTLAGWPASRRSGVCSNHRTGRGSRSARAIESAPSAVSIS
jgi:hypothetical protein